MIARPVLYRLLFAISIVGLSACGKPAGVGIPAPEMTLSYLDGRQEQLSDLQGKVVLLNFWATWCPPCRVELPHLQDLYQAYQDDGLVVVGVSMDVGDPGLVERFLEQRGLTYPVAIGAPAEMEAIWSRVRSIATVDGFGEETPVPANGSVALMPTTFIINREGMIHEKHVGPRTREQIEPRLRVLMGLES